MRGGGEKRCLGKVKHKIVWQANFIFVVAQNSDTVAMQARPFANLSRSQKRYYSLTYGSRPDVFLMTQI